MIQNATFTNWSNGSPIFSSNANIIGPNHWYIKTLNGAVNAICRNAPSGMLVEAYYPGKGYLYIRQLLPDVLRFSGKSGVLTIDVSRDSWQELNWDVYIRARLSSDNMIVRPFVIDTDDAPLVSGRQTITVPFTVPDLIPYKHLVSGGNALTTAFRLIGDTQNTQCTIHSIKMVLDDSPADCELTEEQITKVLQIIETGLRGI